MRPASRLEKCRSSRTERHGFTLKTPAAAVTTKKSASEELDIAAAEDKRLRAVENEILG